jgi:DNA polymerase-3 subunit beta
MGTDGKRLARANLSVAIEPSFSGSYIIPLKTVEELLKNLTEEGEAKVFLMHDKVAVEASQTIIISKLLTGEYPDIDRVIPASNDIIVSLHREELMTLLRQVSLFTADSASVRFTFAPGELKLTANAMDVGEGKVSMPVNYQGPKLEIAFNPTYFLDILRHSKGETISVGVTDAYNPGVITEKELAASAEKPSPLFVLMPLRLHEA